MSAGEVKYVMSLKDLFTTSMKGAEKSVDHFEKKIQETQSKVSGFGKAIAAYVSFEAIKGFGEEMVSSAMKTDALNSSLKFSEGSAEKAAVRFDYLAKISDKLGLNIESAADGYTKIAAASKGTALEGRSTEKAFEGVSTAASVLHLSADNTGGALNALSQMISKGKVSAEELRGQLGERIPGAFQIAARAMNMSTVELDKYMSTGKLLATDFLPKFSEQLMKEFGNNIPDANHSAAMSAARLSNSYYLLKKDLSDGLRPAIIFVSQALTGFVKGIREAISWVQEYSVELKTIGIFIGTYALGIMAYTVATSGATIATGLLTAAQWLLNKAMLNNPVGWVVAGISTLVAGIYWAWNTFEGFRLTVMGLWGAFKQVFTNIGNFFKKTFEPVLEAIQAFKDGRYIDAGKAVAKLAFNLSPAGLVYNSKDLGRGVGAAYETGYGLQQNEEYFNKKKKEREGGIADFGQGVTGAANPYTSTGGIPSADKAGKGHGGGNKIDVKIGTLASITFMVNDAKNDIHKIKYMIKNEVDRTLISAVNDFQTVAGR